MTQKEMDRKQYTEITKSLEKISEEMGAMHNKFSEMDGKVTSISNWIAGDPNIPASKGTEEKIQYLSDQVDRNSKELERVKRIDAMESKVNTHEKKLDKIYTIIFVISILATIIGTLAGIFIPPYIG